jgi:acetolactate synthase-1/2/3 large subunit
LKLEGVEYLFSYPNHPLIDAAAGIGIRPIIARSEKTLINVADGYARATNGTKPTVIVVQAGPGIENAFGGLAQAFADGIPVLTIPGGPDQHRLGEAPEFDPLPVYRHISKWVGRINFADRIPELASRAFAQLRNGKPGPVLLELPRDITGASIDDDFVYTPRRGYRSAGDPADVAEAARILVSAKRPLLHVGHGVHWSQAWDELRELAELVQAPVMTTMAGKSAFPENHPLSLGAGGHTITRTAAHFLVGADVVFGVGCSFARGGFSSPIPSGKTLVQLTVDARDIDKDYVINHAVVGDAKLVLRQIIDAIKASGGVSNRNGEVTDEVRRAKNVYLDEWLPRLTSQETPINPYRVIWDLLHTVDVPNTIITHDSGNPRDQTMSFYEASAPRGYIGWGKSTQLGTGYGIALGAKLACPDKLCINVMGDLAFGTAGMEVETAVRERIPIMTVVLNNSCMGGYGGHMPTASANFRSNRLSGDYAGVAKALGAYSERVENPADVVAAIRRGVKATQDGTPVVLEMITKEEPIYPVAARVIAQVAGQEVGAPAH